MGVITYIFNFDGVLLFRCMRGIYVTFKWFLCCVITCHCLFFFLFLYSYFDLVC